MVPSPAPRHNLIRQRIAFKMIQFVTERKLGIILEEMDFRLNNPHKRDVLHLLLAYGDHARKQAWEEAFYIDQVFVPVANVDFLLV